MKKPIIGITGGMEMYEEEIFRGFYRIQAVANYTEAIIRAGGVPIVIPPTNLKDNDYVDSIVAMLDGLLMTGGNDVNPLLYGEEPREKLGELMVQKDVLEKRLLDGVVKRDIPVIGICRGLQMLNVYFGGTLYQDLSENPDIKVMHEFKTELCRATHTVNTLAGSGIQKIIGDEYVVNSAHHQVVKDLAKDFVATAHAKDGVIEAIEHKNAKYIRAVQFHPEMMAQQDEKMQAIFDDFVAACV